MRLGLRLTARQTEGKSTEKAEDRPADTTDGPADGVTAGPDDADTTTAKPADGGADGLGDGEVSATADTAAETGDAGKGDVAAGRPVGGEPVGGGTAGVAGAAVGGDTAELDAADTARLDKQDQEPTVSLPAVPGQPAAPGKLAGPGRLGQGMAGLGAGAQSVRRWGTTAARLWQPGPGIREAADPGGRAFAMVTILPALLLIAWLLPGLVLLLANRFLPAPMVLISVPVAVALTMLAARYLPGRWPMLDTRGSAARTKGQATAANDQPAAGAEGQPAATAAEGEPAAAAAAAAAAEGKATATEDQAADGEAGDQTTAQGADSATAAEAEDRTAAQGQTAAQGKDSTAAADAGDLTGAAELKEPVAAAGAEDAPPGAEDAAPGAEVKEPVTAVDVKEPVTAVQAKDPVAAKAKGPAPAAQVKSNVAATAAKANSQSWAAWWGLGGTVAIAVVFAAWQLVVSSPQFIVSRDPGVYAQVAYWIADHGVLPIPASLAAFGGAHPGLTFASFGFTSHGTAVIPGVTAGLPIVLAAGMWVHGVTGAAVMSPLLGAFAVLAVGGLTGRLAGPQWAPAGAFLVALTIPEIYTSRSAFGEILAQALLFGGLCLVVDSFSSRRPLTLAVLGGVTLGLTVLAGTGLLLVLLPIIPVAGVLLAGRRPQAIPFTAGLVAGVVCGVAAGIGLDFPAVRNTSPSLALIGILAAGLLVLTGLGVTVGLVGPLRRRAQKLLAGRPLRWLPDAAAVLVLLGVIGLAIRPYVQKVRGPADPYVAALQRLEGLPIDPGRLYAENTLYWVIWYLGIPALLLGVIGLAMVTRQCLRALITWRDPSRAAQSWALPLAIIGWGLFAILWQPDTVPDQPWASRRLVPVVLPGLVVLAVWVASWLIGRAHARGAGLVAVTLATACFVVALAEPPAAITFGIELSRPANPATRAALSGLAFRRTGAGQVTAVERLCGAIPGHSSVLLLDKAAARAFTQVIRGTCDVPAGVMTSSAPGEVDAIIAGIERAGRHPVLLASRESELVPYGASPTQIVNLATQQDAQLLTRPPTSTWPVRYTLWMSAPGGTVNGS